MKILSVQRFQHLLLIQVYCSFLQRKGEQKQIRRSLSVPVNDKERSIRRMDSFFRVIPATPRVKEGEVMSTTPLTADTGNNPTVD